VSQPGRTEHKPSRITGTEMAIMAAGDVAELVTDSRGNSWGRWYSAGARSWSDWRHVPGKPEAVAIAGPYADPAQAGTAPEAALVAVVGRSPDDRQFFLLTSAGLAPVRL